MNYLDRLRKLQLEFCWIWIFVLSPGHTEKSQENKRLTQIILLNVCRVSDGICDLLEHWSQTNKIKMADTDENVFWLHCEIISYIMHKLLLVHLLAGKKNTWSVAIGFLRKLSFNLCAIWKLSCIHSRIWIAHKDKEKNHTISHKSKQLWIHYTNLTKTPVVDDVICLLVGLKKFKRKINTEFDKQGL